MKNKTFSYLGLLTLGVIAGLLGYWIRNVDLPSAGTEPQRVPKKAVRIAAIGDVACPPNLSKTDKTCQMAEVQAAIKKAEPDSILLLGDLQYDRGEPANFTSQFGPLWSEFKSKTYAVPGNHEYYTAGAEGYFGYWNGSEVFSKQAGERGKGYYSFNLGAWHLVALNSNCEKVGGCDEDSPQGKWLRQDLIAHSQSQCTLAFWHHPHFTSGRYSADNDTKHRGSGFWQTLANSGADIVLNGHDHLYERMTKQNETGALAAKRGGIRQFTVGTGGRSLYDFTNKEASHEFGTSTFGYLQLNLKEISYEWSFKDINGQVLDHGSSVCNNP